MLHNALLSSITTSTTPKENFLNMLDSNKSWRQTFSFVSSSCYPEWAAKDLQTYIHKPTENKKMCEEGKITNSYVVLSCPLLQHRESQQKELEIESSRKKRREIELELFSTFHISSSTKRWGKDENLKILCVCSRKRPLIYDVLWELGGLETRNFLLLLLPRLLA